MEVFSLFCNYLTNIYIIYVLMEWQLMSTKSQDPQQCSGQYIAHLLLPNKNKSDWIKEL